VNVKIPSVLEAYTNGARSVVAHGVTLDAVLHDLDRQYPGIRFRMIDERGEVRPHMRVFVNGELAPTLDLSVDARDEIVILQALSGG
jgi:sulfur-carrier protein